MPDGISQAIKRFEAAERVFVRDVRTWLRRERSRIGKLEDLWSARWNELQKQAEELLGGEGKADDRPRDDPRVARLFDRQDDLPFYARDTLMDIFGVNAFRRNYEYTTMENLDAQLDEYARWLSEQDRKARIACRKYKYYQVEAQKPRRPL